MRNVLFLVLMVAATAARADELPAGWVGLETCEVCHDEVAAAFATGPHGKAMAQRDGDLLERACESCHGPGEVHVDDPSTANIRTLAGRTRDASAGCPTCHAAQSTGLAQRTPAHQQAGVTCLECHASGHQAPTAEPLLARSRAATCAPCHATQANSFLLPSAHRDGSRPFECMSCHAVHGGVSARGRIEEDGQVRCVTCHSEKAGPFVYPHPPLDIDGCTACHLPHGSPNPRQWKRAEVMQLCLECHSPSPRTHNLADSKYRVCLTCHAAIHGSQRDPKLFQE